MSTSMDKALMAMSLDEEDIEVKMPDLPEFCSSEQNVLSIIGRLLNPERQKMSSLILDMPRKWQKVGKVRGVALSKEKFQFIFNTEHDLQEVLDKGIQVYNEWSIVMERWKEVPPPNFLQTVEIWVQIKNIPMNYYTEKAITFLGELVGQVIEVAFDPQKAQNKDYVRVRILFDVSKPLIRKRTITLPKGGKETISFFYEKVQKRCYHCQRLTHEMARCPILVMHKQEIADQVKAGASIEKDKMDPRLKESDPLFGVLKECQVGVNPITGRPRMAEEVLEGMRQYLMVASGEERKIREERVKKSVKEAEDDPMLQKTVLRLELQPIFTTNLNKGKGLVFGYDTNDSANSANLSANLNQSSQKFMGAAIANAPSMELQLYDFEDSYLEEGSQHMSYNGLQHHVSTVQRTSFFGVGLSGNVVSKLKPRRRPPKNKRNQCPMESQQIKELIATKEITDFNLMEKRKIEEPREGKAKQLKARITELVVPNEGPSSI